MGLQRGIIRVSVPLLFSSIHNNRQVSPLHGRGGLPPEGFRGVYRPRCYVCTMKFRLPLAALAGLLVLTGCPDKKAVETADTSAPAKLPAAAGSVAFPDAFPGVTMASPPEEGAVK